MNAKELKHQHQLKTWTPIIQKCKNSGMTVKDWCVENDINEKRFYYWQRRVREEVLAPAMTTHEVAPTFIKIPDYTPKVTTDFQPDMVLNYGSLRLELKNSVTSELLDKVVQVIRHV